MQVQVYPVNNPVSFRHTSSDCNTVLLSRVPSFCLSFHNLHTADVKKCPDSLLQDVMCYTPFPYLPRTRDRSHESTTVIHLKTEAGSGESDSGFLT